LSGREAPRPHPGLEYGESSMHSLYHHLSNFLKNEDGPTAVEYAVMLALIIVVCISSITTLGSNTSNTFQKVSNKLVIAGS
jgi:pilus assembly protein Flp/PilA